MNIKQHARQALKLKGKARSQYIDTLPVTNEGTRRLLKAIINHPTKGTNK